MGGWRARLGRRARASGRQTSPLRQIVAQAGTDLGGLRDRALLALGFLGAFRRSELVALDVADLEATCEGIVAHVRMPHLSDLIMKDGKWTVEELAAEKAGLFKEIGSDSYESIRGYAKLPKQ